VHGVTYGTFAENAAGEPFPEPEMVERDFAAIAAAGANSVRTYTAPPRWLLDTAQRHELNILIGLPWEQHIAFLEGRRAAGIVRNVRAQVAACAGHPAVLAYVIGNEIPPAIVRWHGRRRVERFLERLYREVKREDGDALATYANFPSTEYLDLPFLDLVCFNVFLESPETFGSYLSRLQNIAGDRPLLISELGLDSRRNGRGRQRDLIRWQLGTALAAGCAGAFVFSWTDEWHRDGVDVDDWDFGITDRERRPKPALAALQDAAAVPSLGRKRGWPPVSVVVCTHNGAKTLSLCLEGIRALEYPAYECIVVDDGSTDDTAAIAQAAGVRLIQTDNHGLSAARNRGLAAARGEIVVYLDDDAWPDRDWLRFLCSTFLTTGHAAVGGPNVPPRDAGRTADCVARAPGGPIHVLVADREAEHLPGCNIAFRREILERIGGFDPQFRVAGDDVDVCWRLRDAGHTLGYHPGAMVWHARRDSVRGFLRQQFGYGRAEALLERKWPQHYNRGGHLTWGGRVYGGVGRLVARRRIYYGRHASGLFQQEQRVEPSFLASLPATPEWYLLIAALATGAAIGIVDRPFLVSVPFLVAAVLALLVRSTAAAVRSGASELTRTRRERITRHALTTLLHVLQPLARLAGRLDRGLTPWRTRPGGQLSLPVPRRRSDWHEGWSSMETHIGRLRDRLRSGGIATIGGGAFERWDLIVRGGTLGAACVRVAIEDHGANGQVALYRVWPRLRGTTAIATAVGGAAAFAVVRGELIVGGALAAVATALLAEALRQAGKAIGAVLDGLEARELVPDPVADARSPVVVRAAPDRRPVEGAVAP